MTLVFHPPFPTLFMFQIQAKALYMVALGDAHSEAESRLAAHVESHQEEIRALEAAHQSQMDAFQRELASITEASNETAAKADVSSREAVEGLVAEARATGKRLLEEERARHEEAVNTRDELKSHAIVRKYICMQKIYVLWCVLCKRDLDMMNEYVNIICS